MICNNVGKTVAVKKSDFNKQSRCWGKWSELLWEGMLYSNCVPLGPGERSTKQREQQDGRNPTLGGLGKIFKAKCRLSLTGILHPDSEVLCVSWALPDQRAVSSESAGREVRRGLPDPPARKLDTWQTGRTAVWCWRELCFLHHTSVLSNALHLKICSVCVRGRQGAEVWLVDVDCL